MAELIWAPSALRDIKNIAEFIGKDSVKAASAQIERFFEKADILLRYPQIGKPTPELQDSRYRELLVGNYRIIYKNDPQIEEIYILTVHHQSRLLSNNSVFKAYFNKKKNNVAKKFV